MHWNYRVVKDDRTDEPEYVIAEVFYDTDDDSKPMGWTESFLGSESEQGLHEVLDLMADALDKPILIHSEVWPDDETTDPESLIDMAQEMLKDPELLKDKIQELLGNIFDKDDDEKNT